MCRNQVVPESVIGQLFSSISQIFRGNHYYEMEVQIFCRECNCQYVQRDGDIVGKNLNSTTQVSAH